MSTEFEDFNRILMEDLRAHGGKASRGSFKGRDLLILGTRGARTGRLREHPLVYSRDNDHLVVVASKGGAPTHPAWFHNLMQHPVVTVEAEGEKFQAKAHVIDGDEYERLYRQHADLNPYFYEYRKKTARKIPVVVLERIGSPEAA